MTTKNTVESLVADGYVKIGSKSYCEFWQKGDDIVTISTKNRATPILNILEQREEINKQIWKRAEHIYRIAKSVDVDVSNEEIIPYISDYGNGVIFDLKFYHEDDYGNPPNHMFAPKKISKCDLYVAEVPDHYDDSCSSEWNFNLPLYISLNATDEEIEEFFNKEFTEKYEIQKSMKNRELYFKLFKMDKTVLKNFLETSGDDTKEDFDKKSWSELGDYLKSIGVDL